MIAKNTILLIFEEKETVDYIKTVCERKGISLADYVVDNFEWDEMPPCIRPEVIPKEKITCEYCDGCDYRDRCPDMKADVNE
jgi:hypothetical protein